MMEESKFNHSIKVPNQYRKAAKLLKQTFEQGASLKGLIFEEKHAVWINISLLFHNGLK